MEHISAYLKRIKKDIETAKVQANTQRQFDFLNNAVDSIDEVTKELVLENV